MKNMFTRLFILSVLCIRAPLHDDAKAQIQAMRFQKLIDGHGQMILNPIIVVEGKRIASIGTDQNTRLPPGTPIQDLSGYTALPGLIDVHTHLSYAWDQMPGTTPWESLDRMSNPQVLFYAIRNARKALECGITTVRDLGSYDRLDADLKLLIDRGEVSGPRMFISGNGLHVSLSPYIQINFNDLGKADGVDDVIRATRQMIMSGVDWIKMYGSTGSDQDVTGYQTFTYEEMKAACDIAHQHGLDIAIHAYGGEAARTAVKAGANSIEHAVDLDPRTLSEMARKRIYYIPTIDHNRYYIDHAAEFGYDSSVIRNLQGFIDRNLETLKAALSAGVPIAMGSDAVFTGFGQNARELEWFVQAGMTPLQAIRCATWEGAVLLRRSHELGHLAPGYLADIIAVKGDPSADIESLTRKVAWVMKDGKVVVDSK